MIKENFEIAERPALGFRADLPQEFPEEFDRGFILCKKGVAAVRGVFGALSRSRPAGRDTDTDHNK